MVREKIVWQYIGSLLQNSTANFDALPMDGFDFVRLSYCCHGVGTTKFIFSGGVTLPAGYEEKDGNIGYAVFKIGGDNSGILNLSAISSFTMATVTDHECAIVLQGIKYESC